MNDKEVNLTILMGMGSALANLLIEKKVITRKELVKELTEITKETEKNMEKLSNPKVTGI